MMEERTIQVLAYNLETILAEKLETVISRGDLNTRPRDYYDIFILTKLQEKNIDMGSLSLAIDNTAKKRATTDIIKNYKSIMETAKNSDVMIRRWNDYRKDFDYAQGIEFNDTCEEVVRIMDNL
jgi:predicted nucleotidyltransferase component of viral defense system